jgi:hypothetical protein
MLSLSSVKAFDVGAFLLIFLSCSLIASLLHIIFLMLCFSVKIKLIHMKYPKIIQ